MLHKKNEHTVLTSSYLKTVPTDPGVYLMLNGKGKVIYVGKARDLRKRLTSYARQSGAEHSKTRAMVSRIEKIETIITATEKEALILEASLIKKHRPRYNVILRDDKSYPLIKVTVQEKWPRVFMTRRRAKDKARYFGPFSSVGAMWSTLKLLRSFFPLRLCKGKEVKKRSRPCLNGQMHRCLAPCVAKVDNGKYQEIVREVLLVLEGRNRELLQGLQKKMAEAAADLRFEEAAACRDQMTALQTTLEKQVVDGNSRENMDVFGFVRQGEAVALAVLTLRSGRLLGQQNFYLAQPVGEDAEILSETIKRFYDDETVQANEVLVPFEPDDASLLAMWLTEQKNARVAFRVPERGDKKRLLEMAQTNATHVFAELENKAKSWDILADSLVRSLHLRRRPDTIECLDISNLSGQQAVGSLVCFVKGEKASRKYRHYKIKTVPGPDDYSMMNEVIERRLQRGMEEGELPDLFIVDGGKGQLNVALGQFRAFGLEEKVDLVGIAKEKDQEGEKLYRPGRKNPILLDRHARQLLFIMKIRDESHRYGITFHRSLRHKAAFSSELDSITGVGPGRKNLLLQTFGSISGIKKASQEELAQVKGIGPELAIAIRAFFSQSQ